MNSADYHTGVHPSPLVDSARVQALWAGLLGGYLVVSLFSISVAQVFGFAGVAVWFWLHATSNLRCPNQSTLYYSFLVFIGTYFCSLLLTGGAAYNLAYFKKILEPLAYFWALNGLVHLKVPGGMSHGLARISGLAFPGLKKEIDSSSRFVEILVGLFLAGAGLLSLIVIYQAFSIEGGVLSWAVKRPVGTFNNPITMGNVFMLVGLVALASLLFSKVRKIPVVVLLGLCLTALLFSQTREAWVGFGAGLLFLFLVKNWKLLWIPAALALILYLLAPGHIQERIKTLVDLKDLSLQHRLILWKTGWNLISENPLLGCGLSCENEIERRQSKSGFTPPQKHVHNSYIQIWVDAGIFAFYAWLSIWINFFWNLIQIHRRGNGLAPPWLQIGVGAAVVGFLVSCIFENHFNDQEIVMILYFFMGLSMARIPKPIRVKTA